MISSVEVRPASASSPQSWQKIHPCSWLTAGRNIFSCLYSSGIKQPLWLWAGTSSVAPRPSPLQELDETHPNMSLCEHFFSPNFHWGRVPREESDQFILDPDSRHLQASCCPSWLTKYLLCLITRRMTANTRNQHMFLLRLLLPPRWPQRMNLYYKQRQSMSLLRRVHIPSDSLCICLTAKTCMCTIHSHKQSSTRSYQIEPFVERGEEQASYFLNL